jgi:hypothetical protein
MNNSSSISELQRGQHTLPSTLRASRIQAAPLGEPPPRVPRSRDGVSVAPWAFFFFGAAEKTREQLMCSTRL